VINYYQKKNMEQNYNNLEYIDHFVISLMEENPRRSLSALFRNMRKKVPLIGDYPILKHIVRICKQNGYSWTRNQVRLACQSSEEYKENRLGEKICWIRDFTGESMVSPEAPGK
jgi:hypothetical protein